MVQIRVCVSDHLSHSTSRLCFKISWHDKDSLCLKISTMIYFYMLDCLVYLYVYFQSTNPIENTFNYVKILYKRFQLWQVFCFYLSWQNFEKKKIIYTQDICLGIFSRKLHVSSQIMRLIRLKQGRMHIAVKYVFISTYLFIRKNHEKYNNNKKRFENRDHLPVSELLCRSYAVKKQVYHV